MVNGLRSDLNVIVCAVTFLVGLWVELEIKVGGGDV